MRADGYDFRNYTANVKPLLPQDTENDKLSDGEKEALENARFMRKRNRLYNKVNSNEKRNVLN
jgi:hypothetical protein